MAAYFTDAFMICKVQGCFTINTIIMYDIPEIGRTIYSQKQYHAFMSERWRISCVCDAIDRVFARFYCTIDTNAVEIEYKAHHHSNK